MAAKVPTGLPATVKTVIQEDYATDKLVLKKLPMPVPTQPDEVLIKVHATAPCKGELTWGRGFPDAASVGKLRVVSQEISGRVVAAPAGSKFKPGDDIYCRLNFTRDGGLREYTLAAESELALKPTRLSALDAAATPLSALTAWQAVFTHGGLSAAGLHGDAAARAANGARRVCVTGASGGVGRMAVQLAALAGARAVVAVSGGDGAPLRALGATDFVDFRVQGAGAWVGEDFATRACDLVVDCAGGAATADCWRAVKDGGTLVCLMADPNAVRPADVVTKVDAKFFIVEASGSNLDEISVLIEAGKLRPKIDSVYEFGQFAEAFERLESGKAKGKIVIKVEGSA